MRRTRRTLCECGKGQRNLPDIDCATPEKHAPRPLGEPSSVSVRDKTHIIVWAVKSPHRAPVWCFAEGTPDNYDAIVSEAWIEQVYRSTELQRQQMIEGVARSAGIHEGVVEDLYDAEEARNASFGDEENRQGDAF